MRRKEAYEKRVSIINLHLYWYLSISYLHQKLPPDKPLPSNVSDQTERFYFHLFFSFFLLLYVDLITKKVLKYWFVLKKILQFQKPITTLILLLISQIGTSSYFLLPQFSFINYCPTFINHDIFETSSCRPIFQYSLNLINIKHFLTILKIFVL